MGVSAAVGQFVANIVTGQQTVSGILDQNGVPFTPKLLKLWAVNLTANGFDGGAFFSYGAATSSSQRWTVCYGVNDGEAETTETGRSGSAALSLRMLLNGIPTVDAELDFVSFGPGAFTVDWTNAPSSAWLINWLAIGGDDITDCLATTIDLASAGSPQNFTGFGFKPDYVEIAHELLNPLGPSSTAEVCIGFASSAAQQGALVGVSRDGQADSAVAQWQKSGRLSLGLNSDQTAEHEAALASLDGDGITLSVPDLPLATRTLCVVAVKGGLWQVGVETQPTAPGTKPTILPFRPVLVQFLTGSMPSNASIDATLQRFTFGAGTSSNEGHAWVGEIDAAATTASEQRSNNAKAIAMAASAGNNLGTLLAEANLIIQNTGFTLNWTTADAVAREFIYAAVGEPPAEAGEFVTHRLGRGAGW